MNKPKMKPRNNNKAKSIKYDFTIPANLKHVHNKFEDAFYEDLNCVGLNYALQRNKIDD